MSKKELTTWVEISRANLLHNVRQFRKILPVGFKIMAIIKSNAYGHDMEKTAKILEKFVDYLAVASTAEALQLKSENIKKPILNLSILGFDDSLIYKAIKKNIEFTIFDNVSFLRITKIAKQAKKKARVHLKIDTGMSRMGFNIKDSFKIIKKITESKNLEFRGLFSHFACADINTSKTFLQLESFNKILSFIKKNNFNIPIQHIANTAGVMTTSIAGNTVRIGLGLYGLYPSELCKKMVENGNRDFKLKPVLSWYTRVIQVKTISKGSGVSYGHTYLAKKKIKLAVLPVGYWDGLGRKLSNIGYVLIKGKKCKILGRVCMNHIMVDVSCFKNIKTGEKVIILGRDKNKEITADELTKQIGTINYGIITRINPLIPRILK